MKYLLILFFLASGLKSGYGQAPTNRSCETADPLCYNDERWDDLTGHTEDCTKPLFYYFHSGVSTGNSLVFYSYGEGGSYVFYLLSGDGISSEACEQLNEGTATVVSAGSFSDSGSFSFNFNQSGLYVLRVVFNDCVTVTHIYPDPVPMTPYYLGLELHTDITCPDEHLAPELECRDCITSFSPTVGQYMVSAWVKEKDASMNTTTYSNASIGISFSGDASTYNLAPSGRIIDGWQRIEGLVEVPLGATDIHLSMQTSSGKAYFDDIRFHPLDGSMVSYVYDPVNLRLMAQLDERNYATFYEYDEEGKLIRVKKETERGVMTIQENRDNIQK